MKALLSSLALALAALAFGPAMAQGHPPADKAAPRRRSRPKSGGPRRSSTTTGRSPARMTDQAGASGSARRSSRSPRPTRTAPQRVVFTWVIGRQEGKLMSAISVPPGLQIPPGVEVKIGDKETRKLGFSICQPDHCEALLPLEETGGEEPVRRADDRDFRPRGQRRGRQIHRQYEGVRSGRGRSRQVGNRRRSRRGPVETPVRAFAGNFLSWPSRAAGGQFAETKAQRRIQSELLGRSGAARAKSAAKKIQINRKSGRFSERRSGRMGSRRALADLARSNVRVDLKAPYSRASRAPRRDF